MTSSIPKKEVKQLHPQLRERLEIRRRERSFEPSKWIDARTDEFLLYMERCNLSAAVVSMSGGVDSSCVAALLKHAQKKASSKVNHPFNPENGGRILGIAQPFHSTPEIQNRAYEVARAMEVEIITVDRTDEYDTSMLKVESAIGEPLQPFAKAMCKSYERTPINYLLASHFGGVVVGTGNKDEDGYLFYYCKFGDGAVDVGLIWDLHKHQVYQVAAALNVPNSVLVAPPSADLAPGQFDEEEIGATYDSVEYCTNLLELSAEELVMEMDTLEADARDQLFQELRMIQSIHNRGLHKADLNPKNMGSDWFHASFGPKSGDERPVAFSVNAQQARSICAFLSWTEQDQKLFTGLLDASLREEFLSRVDVVRLIKAGSV